MEEQIIIQVKPTELSHKIYIMSNSSEIVPIEVDALASELPSKVAMSAAKYNIDCIKITGPHDYTMGIKNTLTEKFNTCFGKNHNIKIDLI